MSWEAFTRSSDPPISGAELAGLPVAGWTMPLADPLLQAISAAAKVLPPLCCAERQRAVRAPLSLAPTPASRVSACWHDRPLNWKIWFTTSWMCLVTSHRVGAA